jgi:hypothetical protein
LTGGKIEASSSYPRLVYIGLEYALGFVPLLSLRSFIAVGRRLREWVAEHTARKDVSRFVGLRYVMLGSIKVLKEARSSIELTFIAGNNWFVSNDAEFWKKAPSM